MRTLSLALPNSLVAFGGAWFHGTVTHHREQVEQIEACHCAHVYQEVLRLETDLLKVRVYWLCLRNLHVLVDDVAEVIEVEGSNLHDLFEEHSCVGGHHDLEEGHHDNQLLCVNHSPQLLQRG